MPDSIPSVTDLLTASRARLSPSAFEHLTTWLTNPGYADFVPEISDLIASESWDVLEESFYTVLPFGTGGRRGPRGVGPNRINARTIAESARGLVDWICATRGSASGAVVVACDTRIASDDLSRICAEVIAGAGLNALIYDGFRPTPQLSFTVRLLEADAGIVVSASHNPPSDNGFKAYGPSGGQLIPPFDVEVLNAVLKASNGAIPRKPFDQGVADGSIRLLGEHEDEAYQSAVLATSRSAQRAVRIVYTPLHGAGIRSVPPVLKRAGFDDMHIVGEQADPDGAFTNVTGGIPNPEEPLALQLAAEQANRIDADIAIGTDPDADRLGCVARRQNAVKSYAPLTGNQIGAILCWHVLKTRQSQGLLEPDEVVVTTTVTSPMIGKIAAHFGVAVIEDLLVGFKYIARVLDHYDDPDQVVFACEESHGYLGGSYTRDKDAAGAALLLAEAAADARAQGRTLWDVLDDIYDAVGYHTDSLTPHLSKGRAAMDHVARMLEGLRAFPPRSLAGLEVTHIIDRRDGTVRNSDRTLLRGFPDIIDPISGVPIDGLDVASDNLLIFVLQGNHLVDGVRASVRPSGTEPKCKFYASGWSDIQRGMGRTREAVDAAARKVREDLLAYALEIASRA